MGGVLFRHIVSFVWLRVSESSLYVKIFQESAYTFFFFFFIYTRGTWICCNTVTVIIPFSVLYWGHLGSEELAALACYLSLTVPSDLMCQYYC